MPPDKEIKYLRSLIRRMIKVCWAYTDHENCVFCDGIDGRGFINSQRHASDCVGNEARKYLLKKKGD
jgi:hypothetical protein